MDRTRIAREAHEVHLAIWEARTWLWPDELPDPLNMLTPEAAAKVLGLEYAVSSELVI